MVAAAAVLCVGGLPTALPLAAEPAAEVASGAPGLTWVNLDDRSGAPLACRVHLRDAQGKPIRPKGFPSWDDHFVCEGRAQVPLAPGEYDFVIERGPEYAAVTGRATVAEGVPATLTNRLHRLADLAAEGWWSGETHVHRPVADIELLMRAEDLHVAEVATWWNRVNPWAKQPPPADPVRRFDGNRFYNVLAGEDERGGGALLFFNLRRPLAIADASREYPSSMKFLAEAQQLAGAWVDIEKPFWWDTPLWLASGSADSVGLANNHMQRRGMLDNEAWGKPRDPGRFPSPRGNGFWTQELYYRIIDAGIRIPPSAGSASGVLANPVGYNRAYVHVDGELTYEKWWGGLRAGQVFVSNGPLLRCRANGQLPGHVFTVPKGGSLTLRLQARLDSRDPVTRIEIVRDGRLEHAVPVSESQSPLELGELVFKHAGWFLIRAVADVPETFRFASTGPFYVEAAGTPRRISRSAAQFFLDWTKERRAQLQLPDEQQRAEVQRYWEEAERFWRERVSNANAD